MKQLTTFPVTDVRQMMATEAKRHNPRSPIGTDATKTSITVHWAGPAVPTAALTSDKAALDFVRSVYVENHIKRIGADGIQYHLLILPSGQVVQARDLDAQLWHCANPTGNRTSIAVHVVIGLNQTATPAAMKALKTLVDHLRMAFRMKRSAVYGHKEWRGAVTLCPGPQLMDFVWSYREADDMRRFTTVRDAVRVRQGPGTQYPIAQIDGHDVLLQLGWQGEADSVVVGEEIEGNANWLHLRSGLGFVPESFTTDTKEF